LAGEFQDLLMGGALPHGFRPSDIREIEVLEKRVKLSALVPLVFRLRFGCDRGGAHM